MTTPDATGTTWAKHGQRVVVGLCAAGLCLIRYASNLKGSGWYVEQDPKTGGPRGYSKCEEVTT